MCISPKRGLVAIFIVLGDTVLPLVPPMPTCLWLLVLEYKLHEGRGHVSPVLLEPRVVVQEQDWRKENSRGLDGFQILNYKKRAVVLGSLQGRNEQKRVLRKTAVRWL